MKLMDANLFARCYLKTVQKAGISSSFGSAAHYIFFPLLLANEKGRQHERNVFCVVNTGRWNKTRDYSHSKKRKLVQMKIFLFSTLIYLHVYARGARGQPFVYLFIILCVLVWICLVGQCPSWIWSVSHEDFKLRLPESLIIQMKKYFCCYLLIMQVGSCSQMKWKERYYFLNVRTEIYIYKQTTTEICRKQWGI